MRRINCSFFYTILLFFLLVFSVSPANAETSEKEIIGNVYEFDNKTDYLFSLSADKISSNQSAMNGRLIIEGIDTDITPTGDRNRVPSFSIKNGSILISYTHSNELLNANDEDWHVVKDNCKKVDSIKLKDEINNGTLILQRSIDNLNWSDVTVRTNLFHEGASQELNLYKTLDIETLNGCYYRIIVVYELARKIDSSKLLGLISNDKYEYRRFAEVYSLYVATVNEHVEPINKNTTRHSLGETALVSDFASYSGTKAITKSDLHYGWDIGEFFVSGFTDKTSKDGEIVFLKNVDDVVTLWFNLKQNIDSLNSDNNLSITANAEGSDQYFQTPVTNFGRGMLIIRYTDYENIKHDPVMYYNYLEANTYPNANTRVQLFEEGDYEVALDYEVTKDQLVDKIQHYRIFFRFSVRNANCMIYPFDIKTNKELKNSSHTPNGFFLDIAKSRYLNVYIKKEQLNEGLDGLVEDTRFNTSAKYGAKYTEEGIYTIVAKNQYTGLETTKKIYVGTNGYILAYMNTDYSFAELKELVERGATIYEDGSITIPPKTYNVSYKFISGTEGRELPAYILDMLPETVHNVVEGTEFEACDVYESQAVVDNGVWVFQGWDAASKVVASCDLSFIGRWMFLPTPEKIDNTLPIQDVPQKTTNVDNNEKTDRSESDADTVTIENQTVVTPDESTEQGGLSNSMDAYESYRTDKKNGIIIPIIICCGIVCVMFVSIAMRNGKNR